MINNYIKTVFRNFSRHKSSFLINVTGLSVGLACSILILLWVMDERRVDKFHADIDSIYQVMAHQAFSETINTTLSTPGLLAAALKEEVPEFEQTAVYTWNIEQLFRIDEASIKSTGMYASPEIFEILSFDVLQGNMDLWIAEPNTVVLSRTTAERYFGNEDVLGQQLIVNNDGIYTVTGVYNDFPANSTFRPGYIMPFDDYMRDNDWVLDWGNNGPRTIVKLHEGVDPDFVTKKISGFIRQKSEVALIDLFLYAYADRYLYGRFENRQMVGGRIEYVRMFSVIALFVLLIACINFMNLSTALSVRRAREVGIRKAIGAGRGSLIGQYMGESVIISFFSLVLAALLVDLVLPVFNVITEKEIVLNYLDPGLMAGLGAITLFTGLVAGSYPALYLSGFEAVQTLKGTIKSSAGEIFARKGLVVFQFTLSIILIVCTILVYNQIQFVQNKNLGYEKENLVAFTLEGEADSWWDTFKQQAIAIPGITNVSGASSRFLGRVSNTYGVNWPGKDPDSSPLFEVVRVDYDLIETLGFRITDGRGFSRDFGADSTRVIINQAAAKTMDMEDPVGKTIEFWGGRQWEITGLVEDFHFQNLRFEVEPLFMVLSLPGQFSFESTGFIRVQSQNIRETLAQVEELHKEVNPAFLFDYTFLDEQYESLYRTEMRMGELSKYFALFAIIISCLGLFGLSAFTAEQRRKEIGIRKVLGATVTQLVKMLSGSFTRLVAIAVLFSIPVSWWLMEQWLSDYAYRVDIEWWVFAMAGGLAVLIAWLTVSWQSVKTAVANPVEALRSE